MKVLITGGGCEEAIDTVRSVTNFSSGKTATAIAKCFCERGADVTALMAERSTKPAQGENCVVKTFRSFSDLFALLKGECAEKRFDAIIHAAAVADFSPEKIVVDGKEFLVGEIPKISSASSVEIKMKRNPKIINFLKTWNSSAILVGFKLTSGASTDERSGAVKAVFDSSGADFVVSNDLTEITGMKHSFEIFKKENDNGFGFYKTAPNVKSLSETLFETVRALRGIK